MAEEIHNQKSHDEGSVEIKDRGMFDFLKKKKEEERPQDQEVIATEFDNVHVEEHKKKEEKDKPAIDTEFYNEHEDEHKKQVLKDEEAKKPGLLDKLHRSNSSSSSSSDEEEGDDEEKKKKKKEKKGLKEKLKEKISPGDQDTTVPVEKVDEEKKAGFLDKIKDKLPGQHKKPEDHQVSSAPAPVAVAAPHHAEHVTTEAADAKEKKSMLEKIKEKLPGYHPKTEEEKEKEKDNAGHGH